MKKHKSFLSVIFTAMLCAALTTIASAQTASDKEIKLANITGGGMNIRLDVSAPNSGMTLVVGAPDGRVFSKTYKSGATPEFTILDKDGEKLPDGNYTFELRLTPTLIGTRPVRPRDDEPEADRAARKRAAPAPLVQSGNFSIVNGAVVVGGAVEEPRRATKASEQSSSILRPAVYNTRLLQHRMAIGVMPDQVIPDDLIVQGSACVGLDCVNGEVFGFDTIRVKENNTRFQFDDTSAAGFPTNNWQIRANSSAAGGASFLAFVDQGAAGNSETGTIVFEVDAGAAANALKVSSNSKVGLRTAVPVLDVHANTSDTPAIRLEQNNSGGFSAQTWDMAGNEANFFVRDVTGGSRLPFRIRPGAPTSSVDIAASGNVGVGFASPNLRLEVRGVAGLPVNTGTAPTGIARFSQASGPGVMDFGFGGAAGFSWIQSTDSTNLGTNFGLLLNPNGGNVGIGTTAPDQKLSVNGEANKLNGGSWLIFSDERLKNIKGQFNRGLKALMQLQPIRYEYKRDNALGLVSNGEHVGFGAQSVQSIVPEAVTTDNRGYLMVNNDPILWTMLNAIKEQQQEIAELKSEVKRLQTAMRKRRK